MASNRSSGREPGPVCLIDEDMSRLTAAASKEMNPSEPLNRLLRAPILTPARIFLAILVAATADGLQLLLGPFGWAFGDQIIDLFAMLLVNWLIGFHWLLLPSFVLELVPIAGEFPTWIACTITVIILRKREQRRSRSKPAEEPVIDV